MVTGISGQGHDLWVSKRNARLSKDLADRFPDVTRVENDSLVQSCDVVVLCLMATVARAVLPGLSFRPGVRLISVMVDISIEDLKAYAPAAASWDITIPLPQIAQGGCPLPCYPNKTTVAEIFGARNHAFAVSDAQALNAHFAASALLSTTLDQIDAGGAWLAQFTGDEGTAKSYIAHMLASALATLDGEITVDDLLAEVSTQGGLNATLKAHMRAAGARDHLIQGLEGLRGRLGLGP